MPTVSLSQFLVFSHNRREDAPDFRAWQQKWDTLMEQVHLQHVWTADQTRHFRPRCWPLFWPDYSDRTKTAGWKVAPNSKKVRALGLPHLQWGSEIRTSRDFKWSKKGWVANCLDFEWELKSGGPTIWNMEKRPPFCQKPFEMQA